MYRFIAVAVLLIAVAPPTRAQNPQCNSAPYGAPPAMYARALENAKVMYLARLRIGTDASMDAQLAAMQKQTDAMSASIVNGAYQSACRAKLDGIDVEKWRKAAERREGFDAMTIAQLASIVILGG